MMFRRRHVELRRTGPSASGSPPGVASEVGMMRKPWDLNVEFKNLGSQSTFMIGSESAAYLHVCSLMLS